MNNELLNIADLNNREENLEKAVNLMKLLAHPVRLSICAILYNLMNYPPEIVRGEETRASQSQVSQYLAKLRQDGIVTTRRDGQTIYYRIKCKKNSKDHQKAA